MSINLPKPIAAYFASEKAADAGALARAKYHHTVVPLSATDGDGAIVVLCRVAGAFAGSPVELQHVFRLGDETIASLEIR